LKIVSRVWLYPLAALALCAAPATAAQPPLLNPGGIWLPQGPGPTTGGQVEGIEDGVVVGAVHVVAPHPNAAGTLYIGAVNGGIWKTTNATSQNPKWEQLTDGQLSNSISALVFDLADASHKTLVAGYGRYSSFSQEGGARLGLLRTTDGGGTWTVLNGGGALIDKNISGVVARGNLLVASVNNASPAFGNLGIWRSTDGGATFAQISQGDGSATGLPGGAAFDLVADPNNPDRLFTGVNGAEIFGGRSGVYRSEDGGATWTKVSNPAMDALFIPVRTNNIEFAAGAHGNVYVAIALGRLAGVFRSGDSGSTWTAMDLPLTNDGAPTGIHPGGQAAIHMAIVADPTDPNLVYISGDRQPTMNELTGGPFTFPNSIGALDFTGRIFRGDASKPAGSQWVHITHSSTLGAPGGGTAGTTAPHADSREMAFDARGDLIEVDDGGIYKRTLPRSNQGDWYSLNGDLQTTELHDVEYDSMSNIVFGGAQDTGAPMQYLPSQAPFFDWLTADGGDASVDDFSTPGVSTRYTSNQTLLTFNRSYWDPANKFLGADLPAMIRLDGSPRPSGQFVTPVILNVVDPDRLLIAANNGIYESFDRADTLRRISTVRVSGTGVSPLAYGAADNPDILYAGSGGTVWVRTGPPPAPVTEAVTFPFSRLTDIAIDPDHGNTAYALTQAKLFRTTDAGATWTDITAGLPGITSAELRSLDYVESMSGDAIAVGSLNGTFFATESGGFMNWQRLGNGLPTVPVLDLVYDPADDVLVIGTLGRGAWKLLNVSAAVLAGGL
jgi:photosystem II stability/assembly factor-like uncharacterized protein